MWCHVFRTFVSGLSSPTLKLMIDGRRRRACDSSLCGQVTANYCAPHSADDGPGQELEWGVGLGAAPVAASLLSRIRLSESVFWFGTLAGGKGECVGMRRVALYSALCSVATHRRESISVPPPARHAKDGTAWRRTAVTRLGRSSRSVATRQSKECPCGSNVLAATKSTD